MIDSRTMDFVPTRSIIDRWSAGLFIFTLHALPVIAIVQGTNALDWIVLAVIFQFGGIGVGVALHRYFAHRSFETSRWFQFCLGLMASMSFGDPIRFAGKHRLHHQHVDTKDDVHTPLHGFWQCWFGNLVDCGYSDDQLRERAPDLWRYPELRWLHRYRLVPGLTLATTAYLVGGFSMLAISYCLMPVILMHQSAAVNYICHRHGSRRYETRDESRNNFLVAIVTLGEGWHNKHHRYPRCARAGFRWWEIDMFYWSIWLFERLGLIWSVRGIPRGALK